PTRRSSDLPFGAQKPGRLALDHHRPLEYPQAAGRMPRLDRARAVQFPRSGRTARRRLRLDRSRPGRCPGSRARRSADPDVREPRLRGRLQRWRAVRQRRSPDHPERGYDPRTRFARRTYAGLRAGAAHRHGGPAAAQHRRLDPVRRLPLPRTRQPAVRPLAGPGAAVRLQPERPSGAGQWQASLRRRLRARRGAGDPAGSLRRRRRLRRGVRDVQRRDRPGAGAPRARLDMPAGPGRAHHPRRRGIDWPDAQRDAGRALAQPRPLPAPLEVTHQAASHSRGGRAELPPPRREGRRRPLPCGPSRVARGVARPTLTAVILARIEERYTSGCIESRMPLADDIIVIDSGSRDATPRIARELGARVIERGWPGFPAQRNFALDLAAGSPWVLFLDADERLTPRLREEIAAALDDADEEAAGYLIPRRNVIAGRVMRGGGWWPDYQARLLRPDRCRYD